MVFGDAKNKVYYPPECKGIAHVPQSDVVPFFSVKAAEEKGFVKAQCIAPSEPPPPKPRAEPPPPAPKLIRNLLDVETDLMKFIGVPLIVKKGSISLSNYYNHAFSGREKTHYAFTISDGTAMSFRLYPFQ